MIHSTKKKFLIVFLCVLSMCGALCFSFLKSSLSSSHAFLNAEVVPLSASVSGNILKTYIKNDQFVKKGEKIFLMTNDSLEMNLKIHEEELMRVKSRLSFVRQKINAVGVRALLDFYRNHLSVKAISRAKHLVNKRVYSFSEYETYLSHALSVKKSMAMDQLDLINFFQMREALEISSKKLNLILQHDHFLMSKLLFLSPTDGYLMKFHLSPGEHLRKDVVFARLVQNTRCWVEAEFHEKNIENIKEGGEAVLLVPSLSHCKLSSHVTKISPVTSDFLSKNHFFYPENDWIKKDKKIKVFFSVDLESVGRKICMPGASARAWILQ